MSSHCLHAWVYHPSTLHLLPPFAPKGANIGLFCLRLLLDPRLAANVAAVHAFEPLPATANLLQSNLEAHGVAGKVRHGWYSGRHTRWSHRLVQRLGGKLCAIAMPGTASMPANRLPAQVHVHRCGLHSQAGCLPFTLYPTMPGNSTAYPREKWEVQRPAMAAAVGQEAADRRFQGATRCGMGGPVLHMDGSCTRLGWKAQAQALCLCGSQLGATCPWTAAQLVLPSLPSISPPSNPASSAAEWSAPSLRWRSLCTSDSWGASTCSRCC